MAVSMPGVLPNPSALARRALTALENELLDRVLAAGSSAAAQAAQQVRGSVLAECDRLMTMLGKLPHALANGIVDLDRGWSARPLTATERQLVSEAWGSRIDPAAVRIVRGAGLSLIAKGAFMHGNPAITVGNTIYIKADLKITHDDLSRSLAGIDLLLHESTHVVQYATLGFATFGKRYLAELRAHHNDPDELYDYKSRKTDWAHETLEGQAEIVGNYARATHSPANANSRSLADALRAKLSGTGIYGN